MEPLSEPLTWGLIAAVFAQFVAIAVLWLRLDALRPVRERHMQHEARLHALELDVGHALGLLGYRRAIGDLSPRPILEDAPMWDSAADDGDAPR